MKRAVAMLMVLCMLLSGCSSWMNGSYSAVTPHTEPANQQEKPVINVADGAQLKAALITLVDSSADNGVIYLEGYQGESLKDDLDAVVEDVCANHPFAVYAVEGITYEIGAMSGKNAVSVHIAYLQNRQYRDKIRRVESQEQIKELILHRLEACETGVVLISDNKKAVDFAQLVADCALEYPQRVMEAPEVTVSRYPEEGTEQIIEVKFTYQSSREELRTLQNKVAPVFQSAAQHVTGAWAEEEKAARLYTFLMDRFDYNIQTSTTPAYSLLLHGVGDHRAFAMVYAAMCQQSNVECQVVIGTRNGEPWAWNVLQIDEFYYYIDLLQCKESNGFKMYPQEKMTDYVWDYSAYQISNAENS